MSRAIALIGVFLAGFALYRLALIVITFRAHIEGHLLLESSLGNEFIKLN